ncbi:MAG: gluconolactonase [Crocinitomicaceae bacterium]|nr:gluconolactonase [Crocinitomicaceae bacterium]|tara:strand:+ start:7841 stop:8878 length:1038 start_codon:yes stop_codon:yes gene_type:complete
MEIKDKNNPLYNWKLDRSTIQYLGKGLQRPECILTEPNGTVWSADARGGLVRMTHDGEQTIINPKQVDDNSGIPMDKAADEARYITAQGSLPNGVCFDEEGNFIIANWGTNQMERMTREGEMETLLTELNGKPLGKTNFPLRDSKGRIWFTVTTQKEPWNDQINTRLEDGYVALMDENGTRIVAEGFCGTNEIRFDDNEEWLYIVESSAWKISRMRVKPNGDLYDREVFMELPGFPDGFAFDTYGNLWVTLIFTDQLIAITPDREIVTILDDSDPETKKVLFEAYKNQAVTPDILAATQGPTCPWMASLSFGGADMKTVYLGSLRGTRIPFFKSPVAGQKMIHWR